MTGSWLAMVIELIVAGLLATTIAYCVILNKRLTHLRGDEKVLKQTIVELITATETAERAIAGLKVTVRECDTNLGDRIRLAERFTAEMDKQLRAGRDVVERIVQITDAARPTVMAARPMAMPMPMPMAAPAATAEPAASPPSRRGSTPPSSKASPGPGLPPSGPRPNAGRWGPTRPCRRPRRWPSAPASAVG